PEPAAVRAHPGRDRREPPRPLRQSERAWATVMRERVRRVKPPIYRGMPYLTIALFVVGLVIYRNWRTHGLAQESLFNDWLLYALVVLGFYFVFGVAG